jgi:hypothetical protein
MRPVAAVPPSAQSRPSTNRLVVAVHQAPSRGRLSVAGPAQADTVSAPSDADIVSDERRSGPLESSVPEQLPDDDCDVLVAYAAIHGASPLAEDAVRGGQCVDRGAGQG